MIWSILIIVVLLLVIDRILHIPSKHPLSPKPTDFAKRLSHVRQARMTLNYGWSVDKRYFLKFAYLYVYIREGRRGAELRDNELVRQMVWEFKEGKYDVEVTYRIARLINSLLIGKSRDKFVLVCIPASTAWKNEKRYKKFSEDICRLSGLRNGYGWIEIQNERGQTHHSTERNGPDWESFVQTSGSFRNDYNFIIFDDVLTTMCSYGSFKEFIERKGGKVCFGIFLTTVPENNS